MFNGHKRTRAALYRLAFAEPSGPELRRIYAHLRGCAHCRAYYDQVLSLRASLRERPATELEQVERVAGALDLSLSPRSAPRQRLRWATAAMAVVLAAVLLPRVLGEPALDGLRERGLWPGPIRGARLHAYCFSERASVPPIRRLRPPQLLQFREPDNRCPLDDRLGLELSVGDKPPPYVFVFGLDARLTPLWYHPIPSEGHSLSLQRGDGERMLPGMIELATNHRRGSLHLYALYSTRPLAWREVAEEIEAARREHLRPRDVRIRLDGITAYEQLVLELE